MELLFSQNYNRIYRYCCLKLGPSGQDAEDCAMEVFFRAFRKVDRLMEHPCPERWLYVAARNITLETLRKQARKKEFEQADTGGLLSKYPDGLEDAERKLVREEESREIQGLEEALTACLKPKEQELYRFLVLEKKNTQQIAEALSISYTSATTKVYRLRKKLRKQLEQIGKKGGGPYDRCPDENE
nr:sigma-70 family RNA polymerase sigma factor [Lientehia hominis]